MNEIENNQDNTGHAGPSAFQAPSPDQARNAYQTSSAYQTDPIADQSDGVTVQADGLNDTGSTSPARGNMVSSLVDQVKTKTAAAVSDQKDGIANRIEELANTVHDTSGQFAGKQDWIAGAIERGATELGSLATSLRNNDLSSLLTQAGSLARKQPALFVGASLLAGFAVARLGKIVVADVSRDDMPTLPEVGHGNH